jgi:Cation transporter/ATPase, N-terminus
MEDGFAKTSEEVLKFFGTNEEVGLTPDQVKQLQAKYGPNGKCALILFTVFCF